ncbi:hypothetical protein RUND412_008694, partial [Rhizina undulata]
MNTHYIQLLIYLPPLYLVYKIFKNIFNLYRNFRLAKVSKLPYIIVPFDDINLFSTIFIHSTESVI